MSFTCDNCGKNPADMYGSWCSECQREEHYLAIESEERWFASCRKCMECNYCWGPDPSDKCGYYDMPLYMVARKKKCKHFKDIIYNNPPTEVLY